MYGYISPSLDKLADSEIILFKAFYCGLCKTIGSKYSQLLRYSTNYENTFLAILLNDYGNFDAQIASEKCLSSPFKKRPVVAKNYILNSVADLGVLLSYNKILDDVLDDKSLIKKIALSAIKKQYKTAQKNNPKLDHIIKRCLTALNGLEKDNCASIDIVSHQFASLVAEVSIAIINAEDNSKNKQISIDKNDDKIYKLCYNIGKFIYLIDALDDVNTDFTKHSYNVFINAYGFSGSRQEFYQKNNAEINFIFNTVINSAIANFNNLQLTQSYNLLKNIVYYGLRDKYNQVLKSSKKLKTNQTDIDFKKEVKKRIKNGKQYLQHIESV